MHQPELISQIAKFPFRSPEVSRLFLQANSTTGSLCPLKSPQRHSFVSSFQTNKLESYDADIPILCESTSILEIVELWPYKLVALTTFASQRHNKLSIPALRTLPSCRNLQLVTQSLWPYYLVYKFLKHFPVFLMINLINNK